MTIRHLLALKAKVTRQIEIQSLKLVTKIPQDTKMGQMMKKSAQQIMNASRGWRLTEKHSGLITKKKTLLKKVKQATDLRFRPHLMKAQRQMATLIHNERQAR